MDTEEFRKAGKEMVDYICDYMESIGTKRNVTPSVEPGYLKRLIPKEAPENPEPWDNIISDIESKIMPGVTHWQHPRFHAYFPSGNSYPSILGDLLANAIGCIGFSWAASPVCQELETIVLDWFGKAIGLPKKFLSCEEGSKGGGVIQGSASDCILVSMLAARAEALRRLKEEAGIVEDENDDGAHDSQLLTKLVAYCSQEAHSCVEKAAKICLVKLRILEPEDGNSISAGQLHKAMEEDMEEGLTPFFFSATFGSTSTCSFDCLSEVGPVCQRFGVWMHVDGAYAGNAMICPEFKYLLEGIEYASSFNTNPNKWLLTSFDCSTMWVDDRFKFTRAMVVDPLYLQHSHDNEVIDYRHWGIPLSRRFRSLKLWFVIRSYGLEGLRAYIRNHCDLAKRFEALVKSDQRFEVCNEVKMGLVCFRLNGTNKINQDLLDTINDSGKLHMIPSKTRGKYFLRFCVVAEKATEDDIDHAWSVITSVAQDLLDSLYIENKDMQYVKTDSLPPRSASPVSPVKKPSEGGAERPPLLRRLTRQFSFTKSVSRDVFQRSFSRNSLHDGVSPIVVLDEDGQQESQEDVFFGTAINGHTSTILEESVQ
ncbi:aromatic-L-amino-acid decarboxylase-like isoform X2 [Hetaerina americana]|uniref:aromatic-L-amino-acid decarboxylase-like isoform X2 n=1 Tax=Hetaerina americana TaxID=62018 RepID=UPI003A7F5BBA